MTSRKAACASTSPGVTRAHAVQTRSARDRTKSSAAPAAPRKAAASSALSGSRGVVTDYLSGPDRDGQSVEDYTFFPFRTMPLPKIWPRPSNTFADRPVAHQYRIRSDDGTRLPNAPPKAPKRNQECLMSTWNLLAPALSLCLAQFAGGNAN